MVSFFRGDFVGEDYYEVREVFPMLVILMGSYGVGSESANFTFLESLRSGSTFFNSRFRCGTLYELFCLGNIFEGDVLWFSLGCIRELFCSNEGVLSSGRLRIGLEFVFGAALGK